MGRRGGQLTDAEEDLRADDAGVAAAASSAAVLNEEAESDEEQNGAEYNERLDVADLVDHISSFKTLRGNEKMCTSLATTVFSGIYPFQGHVHVFRREFVVIT